MNKFFNKKTFNNPVIKFHLFFIVISLICAGFFTYVIEYGINISPETYPKYKVIAAIENLMFISLYIPIGLALLFIEFRSMYKRDPVEVNKKIIV